MTQQDERIAENELIRTMYLEMCERLQKFAQAHQGGYDFLPGEYVDKSLIKYAEKLEAQLQQAQARIDAMRTDAELGAMVRQMPSGSELVHYHSIDEDVNGKWYYRGWNTPRKPKYPLPISPEEALRALSTREEVQP